MEIAPRISVDPALHNGAPVISGTRLPAAIIVGSLAGGMAWDDVMAEYGLVREDVEAALAYASSHCWVR